MGQTRAKKKWDSREFSIKKWDCPYKGGTVGDYDTYMCEKFLECVLVCAGLSIIISCVPMVCVCVCVCMHAYIIRPVTMFCAW